ncbi:MAG TPA: hypothetical protein VFK82_06020, partial [Burkholderiaceae bacterium]|nr:hypothetical protein [Burkholderiaceae bacterium]
MIRINHLRAGGQRNLPLHIRALLVTPRGRAAARLDTAQRRALDVLANEGGSTLELEPSAAPEPARSASRAACVLLTAPAGDVPAPLGEAAPVTTSAADRALMQALSITQDGAGFVFHGQHFGNLRDAVDLARRS